MTIWMAILTGIFMAISMGTWMYWGIGQFIENSSNGNMNGNVHGKPIINLLGFNGVIQCGIANAIKPTITWGYFVE